MEHLDIAPQILTNPGIEIGAFGSPIPGITPFYLDRFAVYANIPTKADCYSDVGALPFRDSSLNYVATSHVIEHTANPLAVLAEWFRVLRNDGRIYMVVPDYRRTFDHQRPLTTIEHMVNDYQRGTTPVDDTHIVDFVYGVDWSKFSPATPPDQVSEEQKKLEAQYRSSIARNSEINIHFHTFDPQSMISLFEAANRLLPAQGALAIERVEEHFPASRPDGFLVVAKVQKS